MYSSAQVEVCCYTIYTCICTKTEFTSLVPYAHHDGTFLCMSGYRQFLYGKLWGEDLSTSDPHTAVLVTYVNDTFVTWQHEPEKLGRFLDHQNCLHRNIQFTMEMERDSHLPFLDRHLQESGWLPQPQCLLKTYPHKPLPEPWIRSPSFQHTHHSCNHGAMCAYENFHDELEFLKTTFRENK